MIIAPSAQSGKIPLINKDILISAVFSFVCEHLILLQAESWFTPHYDSSEDRITEELCHRIDSSSRHQNAPFRFHHQIRQGSGRTADFAALLYATPDSSVENDTILLFEAKRLPTPGKNREREYLMGEVKRTRKSGAIQRFKEELHGKHHTEAVILGYIQRNDISHFAQLINEWLDDLIDIPTFDLKWSQDEHIEVVNNNKGIAQLKSCHPRKTKKDIVLHHIWIECLPL